MEIALLWIFAILAVIFGAGTVFFIGMLNGIDVATDIYEDIMDKIIDNIYMEVYDDEEENS